MSGDTETTRRAEQSRETDETVPESPAELVVRALRDGVVGAIAGLAGTVAVLGTLLVATVLGAFSLDGFTQFPVMLGLDAVLSSGQLLAVGIGTFALGGMVVWPLLLATLGIYLPGETYAAQGLFFGFVTWTGFVGYFYPGVGGTALALYIVLSLVGHFGYGFVMGVTMELLFGDRKPLVSFALAPQSNRPVDPAKAEDAAGSEASSTENTES